MFLLLITLLTSALATWVVVRLADGSLNAVDHDLSGPQKFHAVAVPRIGGVGIVVGMAVGCPALYCLRSHDAGRTMLLLLISAMPTFFGGLHEDISKSVSPRRRMIFTAVSGGLAIALLGIWINHLGFAGLDLLFAIPWIAVPLTVFAVTGVTNAVNIIDGFNGLAAMCVMLMLGACAFVALQVGDTTLLWIILVAIVSVLGFFVWNFPSGAIFLGDGGAYFLGFVVSEIAVMLIYRNPAVSPMFALVVCIYPIVETVFSIYRKRHLRKGSATVPDGVHLHMLVYKRLARVSFGDGRAVPLKRRNSMTSPYLWALCTASLAPAVLAWHDKMLLLGAIVGFVVLYVFLYWRIVRFRTPRWLVARR
jgi:UDP-N-acetylmuramyl pentapeptide phosphotransferase/UDP-N-acetylglucosamine-1-phosphate transferase